MSELAYLNLLQQLVNKADGDVRQDRTGTGTYSIFGHQMRFDLSKGFPLLTTKKIHAHSVVHELLWFLKGDTNIKYLLENNVHIWTEWRYKAYLKDFNDLAKILEPEDTPFTQEEFEQEILNDPKFAEDYGNIGKGYGHQWRNFGEVQLNDCDTDLSEFMNNDAEDGTDVVKTGLDQISWVIDEIKSNPTSRRLIVTGWNPQEVDQVDLPPCHTLFQFFVEPMTHDEMVSAYIKAGNTWSTDPMVEHEFIDVLCKCKDIPTAKLSCHLYQRSADVFLGVPFNIASYALLTHMIAQVCGLAVGEFVWTGGDTHLYANHVEQAKLQLTREPMPLCKLLLSNVDLTKGNVHADVAFDNYQHHDAIKAPVAV